jgi:FtsP/CotA-like multicopper oxidase with cupredoxin domain
MDRVCLLPLRAKNPAPTATMTRRRLLAGIATTLLVLPPRAHGQPRGAAGDDGFRLLRAGLVPAASGDGKRAAYDGVSPGPVLRVKRGEEVRLRLINDLASETSLHWHGVRVPNAMDGVPHLTQPPVRPGGTFDYRFVAPDAGTFWYHAPASEQTGLHGAFIVDEAEPVEVDRDVVLLFADPLPRPLGRRGLSGIELQPTGMRQIPVSDGEQTLDVPVKANERIRLRLVNASYGRPMLLRLAQHLGTLMAIDGQPAEPVALQDGRVALGPGNRVDLFIDMTLAPGATASAFMFADATEAPALRFIYDTGAPLRPAPLPDPKPLPANALPRRIDLRNALRIDLPIDKAAPRWTQAPAAAAAHYGPPLFSAKRGRPVVIAFINRAERGDDAAVLHLHGHHARLLDRMDDGWKPFWLDTIMAPARQTTRIAFVADNAGKWLIDCRILAKEAAPLAAWFEVT